MRRVVVALSSATLLAGALSGCGGDPSYAKSKACGVPVDRVSAVLGTDHFHTVTRGNALPPRVGVTFRCSVNLKDRDDMVTVLAERASSDVLAQQQRSIAKADERFTVAGAQAGIDVAPGSFSGRWTCPKRSTDGTMRVYVTAGKKATAAERRALLTAVAKQASTVCSA